MKTLFLIVIIATTISIAAFGTYVIVHPIFGGIAPSTTINGYIQIDTTGLEKTYRTGQPINFSMLIRGFGLYPCQPPQIAIYDNNTQTKPVFYYTAQSIPCLDSPEHYIYYFPSQNKTFSTIINKTGTYAVKISMGKDSYQKQFSVIPSNSSRNLDVVSVNGTDTGFSINYTITGGNKLSDAKFNSKFTTLTLSLYPTRDGTLTVTIPKALLNAKNDKNQDLQFIMLEDGQEITYKQITSSILDRTLSIQFQNNTSKIEIIATQII